jgi:hypothetical protein
MSQPLSISSAPSPRLAGLSSPLRTKTTTESSPVVTHTVRFLRLALLGTFLTSQPACPQAADMQPAVKMSRSGICHERGTVHYVQTIYFQPYDSMEACLAAGGRLLGQEPRPGAQPPVYRGTHPPLRINWTWVLLALLVAVPAVALPWYRRWKSRRALRAFSDREKRRWEGHKLDPTKRPKP